MKDMYNDNKYKIVVFYFEKHVIFINNELESITISPNNTLDVKGEEYIVETVNIAMSKEEILTIYECLDSKLSKFNVGNLEIDTFDSYVFIYTDYKEIKIPVIEINAIAKFFIESEEIKMNENNITQTIFNKIVNINNQENNKPNEALGATTGEMQTKTNETIYDTVVDTIKNDTKGEK